MARRLAATVATMTLLSACAASAPRPYMASTATSAATNGSLSVAVFSDDRGGDRGGGYFGSVRGGYGNPLERMEYSTPVAAVVADEVALALNHAGYAAERTENSSGDTAVVSGKVRTFFAANYPWVPPLGVRHVGIALDLCLFTAARKGLVGCISVEGKDSDMKPHGVGGNTEVMGEWLKRVLEDSLAQAIGKEDFRALVASARDPSSTSSAKDRLKVLDELLFEGSISNDEYERKRRAILDGL